MSVSGAGIETTMWTLSVATFHILWNPSIEQRLVAELVGAMPDPTQILSWTQLEKLPFLSAVISECEFFPSNVIDFLTVHISALFQPFAYHSAQSSASPESTATEI